MGRDTFLFGHFHLATDHQTPQCAFPYRLSAAPQKPNFSINHLCNTITNDSLVTRGSLMILKYQPTFISLFAYGWDSEVKLRNSKPNQKFGNFPLLLLLKISNWFSKTFYWLQQVLLWALMWLKTPLEVRAVPIYCFVAIYIKVFCHFQSFLTCFLTVKEGDGSWSDQQI